MNAFLKYLNERIEKTTYDVVTKSPEERKEKPTKKDEYSNIKQAILEYVHDDYILTLKQIITENVLPKEVVAQLKQQMVPLSEISDKQDKIYAKKITQIYTIFKKYLEMKQVETTKELELDKQDFPLGTIKTMISQGKTLGEIADSFNVPMSTMALKLKMLYNTSYTILKKQMNK